MKYVGGSSFVCLLISVLASISGANADGWFPPQDHSYEINLQTTNGIPQQAGASVPITGTISVLGAEHDRGWSDRAAFQRLLKSDDLEVRTYFPDFNHPVQVKLVPTETGVSLSFTASDLVATDLNTFIVQVMHASEDTEQLEVSESKIAFEIQAMQLQISEFQKHHGDPRQIANLQEQLQDLQALEASIQSQIQSSYQVIAETRLPLQVGNETAGASLKSSLIGSVLYTLQYDVGSAIQGETANVTATMTKVDCPRRPGDRDHDRDDAEFFGTFLWNGNQVGQSKPAAFSPQAL